MRQGAPRLGGLGLGGVGASPSSPPPRSASLASLYTAPTATAPEPSSAPSSPQKVKRKPSPASDVFQSTVVRRPSQGFALPPAPALPQRPSGIPNERPFLSPEIVKPTFRREAFALDRPVPDGGLGSAAPIEAPPDSPIMMEQSPEQSFSSDVMGGAPSPELAHLRWFAAAADKSLGAAPEGTTDKVGTFES
ncbi:hypothetical protein RQP46_009133 [Phenoliferia psychrophenolica]